MELLWEALRDLSLVAGSASQSPSPDHRLQSQRSTNNHACSAPRSTTAPHTDSAHAMHQREPIPTTMRIPPANGETLRRVCAYRGVSAILCFRGGED